MTFTGTFPEAIKSRHKAKCPHKRYLGGELTLESSSTEETSRILALPDAEFQRWLKTGK
jgi:hypothetical protein